MRTIKDIIDKGIVSFKNSLNVEELKEAYLSVASIQKDAIENNLEKVKILLPQMYLKIHLLEYVDNKFSSESYEKTVKFIDDVNNVATKNNQQNTLGYALEANEIVSAINKEYALYKQYITTIKDASGKINLTSLDIGNKILQNFNDSLLRANEIKDDHIFFKYARFISLKNSFIEFLENEKEEFLKVLNNFKDETESELLNRYGEKISSFCQIGYKYVPLMDVSSNAKILCVNTPVENDLLIYLKNYANNNNLNIFVIDCNKFQSLSDEDIKDIFLALTSKRYCLYLRNLENYQSANRTLIISECFKLIKNECKIFLIDKSGLNSIYNDFIKNCSNNENSSFDVSFVYLSLPFYNDLCELFIKLGCIKDTNDNKNLVKQMPFLTFESLNRLLDCKLTDEAFLKKGIQLSKDNDNENVKRYLKNLPKQTLLIDSNYGQLKDEVVVNEIQKYDYDAVREIDLNNIKLIIEGNYSFHEKAGMLVRYCLLSGNDISTYELLDEESYQKRIEYAVLLVYKLFGIDYVPKIEIKTDLDGAAGLCCNNGRLIKFLKKDVSDYDEFSDTLLHESMHAFQHYAIEHAYNELYFKNLGVTVSRIEEWKKNFDKYYGKFKEDYEKYRYQIVESDANSFARDAILSSSQSYFKIDFE